MEDQKTLSFKTFLEKYLDRFELSRKEEYFFPFDVEKNRNIALLYDSDVIDLSSGFYLVHNKRVVYFEDFSIEISEARFLEELRILSELKSKYDHTFYIFFSNAFDAKMDFIESNRKKIEDLDSILETASFSDDFKFYIPKCHNF